MKTNRMNLKIDWKTALAIATLALGGSSCLVNTVNDEDLNAVETYKLGAGNSTTTACAQNAFRQAVHPITAGNCNSCHASAQGSFNPSIAYSAVKSRSNLTNPASSGILVKAGDGHCSTCTAGLKASLQTGITIWSLAEKGDVATCQEYATATDAGSVAKPFDLGAYVPADPNNVVVVQAGLTQFSKTNEVHDLLYNNCAQCHIPGGFAGLAPFAVQAPTVPATDYLTSYKETKLRLKYNTTMVSGSPVYDVKISPLYIKAKTPGHGLSCPPTVCGNAGFYNALETSLIAWAKEEYDSLAISHVKIAPKPIYIAPSPSPSPATNEISTSKTLIYTWNLGNDADTATARADLAGATASISLNLANSATLRFTKPTVTAGTRAIRVKKISIIFVNASGQDVLDSDATSYWYVDTLVPIGQTVELESFPALAALPTGAFILTDGSGKTYRNFRLDFEILQSN